MHPVTIITLTCNRLRKLQACLDRLLPQLGPKDEVLLIDTGSTDGTREHFEAWSHPAVRMVSFKGEGSWAEIRNFGVRQARGAMIAFVDDDCLVEEGWVARGRAALADADAVGGMVRPHGLDRWPHWWHPGMSWLVGLSPLGHLGVDAGRVHYPFTANLWARASVCRAVPFQEIGGRLAGTEIEPDRDRWAQHYIAGREDAQWWRRLRTEGYRVRFDPKLAVAHAIDPGRLSLDYLRRRAEQDGRAWAQREGLRADLPVIAYQWWRELWTALDAPWAEPDSREAHWHLHQLMRRCHGQALDGLVARHLPGGATRPGRLWNVPILAGAGGKLLYDQGKTFARTSLRRWLRAKPVESQSESIDRLAVIAFGYLGDLVILQSVLRGLMQAHPGIEVYVLAPAAGGSVLRGIRRLNYTPLPADVPPGREAGEWLVRWLEQVDPSAIVAPYLHEPWGRILMSIRRPPKPISGFDNDMGLSRMRYLERLSARVHKNLELHESQNLCRLFESVGLPCEPEPAAIEPLGDQVEHVREHPWLVRVPADEAPPLIMFNPDAGQPFKEWTDEAWIELLRMILKRTDWRVVVNETRPRAGVEAAIGSTAGRVLWLRSVPLEQLVAWMSVCTALVTVDAGPQHLAHGLGLASLTLYGRMDERRWVDLWERPNHRTLRACTFDLTPDELRGLAPNHEVTLIRPEAVFDELTRLVRDIQA